MLRDHETLAPLDGGTSRASRTGTPDVGATTAYQEDQL
jgi:hypothetical protein